MKIKSPVIFFAIFAVGLACSNCTYFETRADMKCAEYISVQIAESTAVHDFAPRTNDRRILGDVEKKTLFSKIALPSCASNAESLETKYEVALTPTSDSGFRIDVWLKGVEPNLSN